eukprot:SAG25_NODE_5103_length_702_cov_0.724710_2_plen_137_part_00
MAKQSRKLPKPPAQRAEGPSSDNPPAQVERAQPETPQYVAEAGYALWSVPKDGNCWYASLAEAGLPGRTGVTHKQLHMETMQYLVDHREQFSMYVPDDNCATVIKDGVQEGTYATQLEMEHERKRGLSGFFASTTL